QSATVAAGKTVFVTVTTTSSGTVTVGDGTNTYTKDADSTLVNGVRTLVFSWRYTSALNSGTITVNLGGTFAAAASFDSFDGLVSAAKDQSHTNTGTAPGDTTPSLSIREVL